MSDGQRNFQERDVIACAIKSGQYRIEVVRHGELITIDEGRFSRGEAERLCVQFAQDLDDDAFVVT